MAKLSPAPAVFLYDVMVEAFATISGVSQYDEVGGQVAAAGDLDGDGNDDLLVGIDDRGKAYVYHGPLSGDLDHDQADTIISGEQSSGDVGWNVVRTGDLDGDGQADLMLGGRYDHLSGLSDNGGVYIWEGPVTAASVSYTSADYTIEGSGARDFLARFLSSHGYDYLGWDVAADHDVDEDGLPDIILGAYGDDDLAYLGGAAFVITETPSGTYDLDTDYAAKLGSSVAGGALTRGLGVVGDLDGDGTDDPGLGAPSLSSVVYDGGRLYLLPGTGW